MPKPLSRRFVIGSLMTSLLIVAPTAYLAARSHEYPPDTTPEGAYMRIVQAVQRDALEDAFAYLETEAQWACFSIHDYRKRAHALVEQSYPEPERSKLLEQYARAAKAPDGQHLFADEAKTRGWITKLRRDLSGVASVEIQGERASIETVRKTRYPFRKRDNGIWGLTLFTAELKAEAQAAARDFSVVERAAKDYEAAQAKQP